MPAIDEVIAYHEAGHVIAALALGATITSVDLQPGVSANGVRLSASCDPRFPDIPDERRAAWVRVVYAYAGSLAQAQTTGEDPVIILDAQHDDHNYIQALVEAMAPRMTPEELFAWRLSAWDKASDLVTTKWEQLRTIAQALLRERTLDQEQLGTILPPKS